MIIKKLSAFHIPSLKARPEYKVAFSSTTMFYRALHAISTQRFKLPVRRYILDLFDIPLDNRVVETLLGAEKALHTPISPSVPKQQPRRVLSILGRAPRRRGAESDEEEDIVDEKVVMEERPTISLRPVSRIVGFEK
jgi:rapamycin-insensitive companion of mTOR